MILGFVLALLQVNYHVFHSHRDLQAMLYPTSAPPSPKQQQHKKKKRRADNTHTVAHQPVMMQSQSDPNKPYVVLHVGPPKVSAKLY